MLNIKYNYPLKNTTTLQIGGPAKKFVAVKTEEELIEAIKYAKENNLEFLVIGGGSNLLVSDNGTDKLIIKNEIFGIKKQDNNLIVKSGTILQDLVNFANDNGLSGLQKLAGIPGTVGGAVFGNAGAYGQTISDNIVEVKHLNTSVIPMKMGIYTNSDCQFGYRYSDFKKSHFPILEIEFSLTPANPTELQKISEETIAKRNPKYPPGIKCPGSFFKNILANTLPKEILTKIPEEKIPYGKVSVGYLLEEVGAKGDRLGNIEIAPYHANLFINKGGGLAKDFYELAKKYAKKVYEKFGITLEPEVQLINLPNLN